MKRVRSSIPPNSVEKPARGHRQKAQPESDRVMDCFLDGIRVGQRVYNREGRLILETPLRDGHRHGWELTRNEDGSLALAEPYVKGLIHGTAMQYGGDGTIIGTYTLLHGTGFDIWRQVMADKSIVVTEIHSIRDGVPHGHEWFFTFPQQDLWQERNWHRGKLHGMERVWNRRGRLRRGYPKFYISDQVVSRRRYLNLARADRTLPPYQEQDDQPYRSFPPEIREILQIVH